jgi:hypothetical protein
MFQHLDFFLTSSELVLEEFLTILLHLEKIAIIACKGVINIIRTDTTVRNQVILCLINRLWIVYFLLSWVTSSWNFNAYRVKSWEHSLKKLGIEN